MQTIRVNIGETMTDLLRENPYPGYLEKKTCDVCPIIWPGNDLFEPQFHFVYMDQPAGISFPHARMIWVEQKAGVVTSVLVSGSETKTTIEEFYKEVSTAVAQLTEAGWQPTFPLPRLSTVQQAVKDANGSSTSIRLTSYQKNGTSAALDLTSPGRVITPGLTNSRAFILDVSFTNQAFENQQAKKVYEERDRVANSRMLPLSHWLEKQKQPPK